ncbi:uncharacterized protein LOC144644859 [Oculina patagonica]
MKSLFLLSFLLCISISYALKCYNCMSTKNWDDCADANKEIDCPSSAFDRCFKAYSEVKGDSLIVEGFQKGCLTAALCDATEDFDFCKGKGECKIDCCSGDLCNAAALQLVSAIVLITCALVALLH